MSEAIGSGMFPSASFVNLGFKSKLTMTVMGDSFFSLLTYKFSN
jgi:hypothetical protein